MKATAQVKIPVYNDGYGAREGKVHHYKPVSSPVSYTHLVRKITGCLGVFLIFIVTFASRRVTLIAIHSKAQKQDVYKRQRVGHFQKGEDGDI